MSRVLRSSLFWVVAALCISAGSLLAQGASAVVAPLPPPPIWLMTWQAGATMLVILFVAFYAMTRYNVPLPLAMSLVSCTFLVLQWDGAPAILRQGFEHYAAITISSPRSRSVRPLVDAVMRSLISVASAGSASRDKVA